MRLALQSSAKTIDIRSYSILPISIVSDHFQFFGIIMNVFPSNVEAEDEGK
jgi:hypothetical protein